LSNTREVCFFVLVAAEFAAVAAVNARRFACLHFGPHVEV
jgi:hypothetical protein